MVIRNPDDEVKVLLKQQAARYGWSMEKEARQILRNALPGSDRGLPFQLGSKIAARFSAVGLEQELPELHGQAIVPMGRDE
jgi:plasmid stability protein